MSKKEQGEMLLKTGIDSFDEILKGGLHYLKDTGLFGVIFGASGSGKSVLGIQMCCSSEITDKDKKNKYTWAIYISQETPEVIKKRINNFSYYGKNENVFEFTETYDPENTTLKSLEKVIENINKGKLPLKRHVHLVHLPVGHSDIAQTLRNIFRLAAIADFKPLVCIDNANLIQNDDWMDFVRSQIDLNINISSESKHPIDDKYKDFRFYKQLHSAISKTKIPTFLIFEENHSESKDILTRPESYAADVVVQLGFKTYPAGYSERFLDVIKVKNQFYYRGQNHCSIVSRQGGGRQLDDSERNAIGVIIYPQIATQLTIVKKQNKKRTYKKPVNLGIPPLDKKIYKEANTVAKYLTKGSTNVLVSDLDSKATEIGLHFATQNECDCLYISLLHDNDKLKKMATRFGFDEHIVDVEKMSLFDVEEMSKKLSKNRKDKKHLHCLWHLSSEYVSGHKLLHDIQQKIRFIQEVRRLPLVIVLDNVYELECKYPLLMDTKTFLSALLDILKRNCITSLIIDTVEAGEYKNPLESSFAAGLADNVFLLRHVEFQSKTHRVFSTLKLAGDHTPDMLWDLREQPKDDTKKIYELVVEPTFALYKNVLSGKPEPIDITISLYKDQDDSPMHHYIEAQRKTLSQYFGEGLKLNTYGAEEHAKMQNLLKIAESRRQTGCHIVALDEFWLKKLIKDNLLEEIGDYIDDVFEDDGLITKESFVCAAHDIAIYEKYKDENILPQELNKWYAIPARNNCGILCFDPVRVGAIYKENNTIQEWLKNDSIRTTPFTWKDFCKYKEDYTKQKYRRLPFFTFCMDQLESCVSFLIELCLSYEDHKNRFYTLNKKNKVGELNIGHLPLEALIAFTELLDKNELEQIASGKFRSSNDEPQALFSRQWMSTLGCLRNRKDEKDWFYSLSPYELPRGVGKTTTPTPVSGTWYLGIIKDSIAVETGVRIIQQFTSKKDEIYKSSNYIGLPVRKNFYFDSTPYATQFRNLADIQEKWLGDTKRYGKEYQKEILSSTCPFYRILVDDYEYIAPILWRLMIKAATAALNHDNVIDSDIAKQLIQIAEKEYNAIKQ